jgi:protein-disulfide isomerase
VTGKPREIAARRLARQRAAERRRTALIVAAVALVVLVAAAVVGVGVYHAQTGSPARVIVPRGGTSTGIVVGKPGATVTVDVYLDFLCPHCRAFEQASGPTLDRFVAAGTVRVVYHPVAFLDPSSTTRYSTRASAASACAADAGVFPAYLRALYVDQPPEGSAALSDTQLIALGRQVGATSPDFAQCVTSGRYRAWTAAVTDAASRAGVGGTPTVLVAGKPVDPPTTDALTAAIQTAARGG